jgi:hypothetical protein
MLPNKKNIESLSLLNKKIKLSQLMRLHPKTICPREKARLMGNIPEQHHERLPEEK